MSDCTRCGHAANLHDVLPAGCIVTDSEGPCHCLLNALQVDAQAPIYDPTDYEHHCVGGSAGSCDCAGRCPRCKYQPCQCNPHAKHVQLTYARSERPGEQVRPGTSYYTAHVVLRHEATATLWVFASPDDFAARHEAQRWEQDTGVRHTVVVCTLIATLPDVGAVVPEVGTEEGL